MMVTILLGEQGAMIALSSHSDPPLIYFYLEACKFTQRQSFDLFRLKEAWKFTQRPSFDLFRLDNAMDGYTQAHAEKQRERHYYTTYGTAGCVWHQKKPWEGSTLSLAYGRFTGRRWLTMSGLSVA